MGAKVAKPNPPEENEAKADNDLAMQGLEDTAQRFLSDCRMGVPSGDTLGYPLADEKLQNQEIKLLTQTEQNVPADQIEETIDQLFSADWKGLVTNVAQQLAVFFSGDSPKPTEKATYNKFQKSYLKFESDNVVQYSVLVVQTNAKSTGTLTANNQMCLQAVVCKGLVAYAKMSPQTLIYNLRQSDPDLTQDDVIKILDDIKQALDFAKELAGYKQTLMNPALKNTIQKNAVVNNADVNRAAVEVDTYQKRLNMLACMREQEIAEMKQRSQATKVDTAQRGTETPEAAMPHLSEAAANNPSAVCLDIRIGGAHAGSLDMALRAS